MTFVALTFAVFSCLQQQLIWSTTLSDCGTPHTTHHDAVDDAITQSSFNLMIEKFTQQQNPPTNIYVLGERNSGTNYAAGVLRKAFNPPNEVDPSRTHEYFSSDIPVLRHKHMLRHSLLNETELAEISKRTDILWVLAVRSPCEWAEAMKRNPWHMCMPNNISAECPGAGFIGFEHKVELREYTLAEFFKMEWGDWPESTNFRNLSFVGDEFIYRNIFHLRRHKLLLMKQIIDAVPRNVKIVRLHELERSPETFIQVSYVGCMVGFSRYERASSLLVSFLRFSCA